MTRQEKEQLLLQLEAQQSEAQNALRDSDYIDNQIVEGVEGVDAKYNNAEVYPQYGGNWRAFRSAKREEVRAIRAEIERVKAIEPEEDPRPEPENE